MKRGVFNWILLALVFFCAVSILGFTKNTSAADASAVEDFVTRFYELCLGRSPDQAGLDGWVSALLDGTQTGSDVAYGFVFSQEFLSKNTTDEEYLQVLYEAFFNRQPDAGGKQGWLDAMKGGASREDVLKGYIFAAEFNELCREYGIMPNPVAAFVTRFYQLCLDRDPDAAGLEGWTNNLLNQTQTGADVAEGFIYSPEFTEKSTTNSEFLEILYEAFFDRDADPAGWDTWLEALNAGRDRSEVLNGFIYSQEFSELAQRFGIKAFDALPPPVSSDNTMLYGSYWIKITQGSCSGSFFVTVGDDFSKRAEDAYLYLPATGSSFLYSGYNVDGDYITTSITLSGNTMTLREEGLEPDGSGWVSTIQIEFAGDYNSFTLSGSETDDDPDECDGALSGSGSRLQFTGPFDGIWSGDAVPTTAFDNEGDPCTGAYVKVAAEDSQVFGIVEDADGDELDITGTVGAGGNFDAIVTDNGQTGATVTGTLSGNSGSGTWNDYYGCSGTWTMTKQ